jgi:hypothetical protein
MIPFRLISAYRATLYRVDGDGLVAEFRPGRPAPEVDAILNRHRALSAAFLTAWNPRSRPQPQRVNQIRERRLEQMVRRAGLVFLPGEGADATGRWPAEKSLLVLSIGRDAADRIAAAFGQNAYIWLERNRAPRLILCR